MLQTLEERALHIQQSVKCPTCIAQALNESDVPLAVDMKNLINLKLRQGDTDASIYGFLEQTYGTSIFLDPPYTKETLVLWGLPFVLFVVILFGMVKKWYGLKQR